MRSSDEAVAYAKELHKIVTWIGICDGNMQEGSFRCDANVSVRPRGSDRLGTRCEIKNLNSFRFLERAIEYEVHRQIEVLEAGGRIEQETRLYDPDRDETRSMRSKEEAHDYRYFPDPDLLPLAVSEEWIEDVRARLPELPQRKRARYESELGLTPYDAVTLTQSRELAEYFEATLRAGDGVPAKTAANWVMGELAARLNEEGKDAGQSAVGPDALGQLLARIQDGTISGKIAKEVFDAMWAGEGDPDAIIEKRGLRQISDAGALEAIVAEVVAANPRSVEEFRAGKERALNALVGQVMKATQGKANPQQVNDLLKKKLAG
jgi:aspartyl-tRNA(Asn)/glutamyl-tRNA(Gln) amidotransferase subunit B